MINYWISIYEDNFKDNLDPYLGLTKSEQIFKSRATNQSFLLNNNNIGTQNKNFGLSPYGQDLKVFKLKLSFTLINHNFKKNLEAFAKKYKNFKQFLNENSNYHPKVFKNVIIKDCEMNYYDELLSNIDWVKIIRFDFYLPKNHFEFLFVIKDLGYFLDLYVNRKSVFKDIDNVNNNNLEKYMENFKYLCKIINVKENDLIKFIQNFVDF